MEILLLLFALGAGILMPVQAGVNAELSAQIGGPLQAALVSFVVGTLTLVGAVILLRLYLPDPGTFFSVPVWKWCGGFLGALFVTATIFLAPRLGAVTLLALLVTGQMSASLILDHFGWLGYPEHAISVPRVLGVAFLLTGVVLVQKF
ncbi:MAG: DMT family transporter, partial [Desulfonatronovibrionaceae bacterium]